MNVSVIVITLNEVGSIERVLEEIPRDVVDEVIVVDGQSTDGTPELVRKMGYKVVMQEEKGYGTAFPTGAEAAKGNVVILMNGDGSQDPKDIPKFLEKIKEGYKVVFASRYLKGAGSDDDTLITYVGNKLFTFLINVIHKVGVSDSLFTFIAIDKEVFKSLEMQYPSFDFCVELPIKLHRKGYKIAEIPSFERKRFHGEKKVHAFFDGLKILWIIIKEAFL